MSAIPEEFLKKTSQLSAEVTKPFPKSQKIYVEGSRADIRVPVRRIEQDDTLTSAAPEKNPPIYRLRHLRSLHRPEATIDLMAGLPALREQWIAERGDTEELDGPTSEYGTRRQNDPELAHCASSTSAGRAAPEL
jgi:phosphomethylpyrimidine synthase